MYMGSDAWDDYTETDAAMQDLVDDTEDDVCPRPQPSYPIGFDDDLFDDDLFDDISDGLDDLEDDSWDNYDNPYYDNPYYDEPYEDFDDAF